VIFAGNCGTTTGAPSVRAETLPPTEGRFACAETGGRSEISPRRKVGSRVRVSLCVLVNSYLGQEGDRGCLTLMMGCISTKAVSSVASLS